MRGHGLPEREEYCWTVQPNGKITIFSVPIFKSYRREKQYIDQDGNKRVAVDEVTKEEIFEIEEESKRLRDLGKYPRTHIGHHQQGGTESLEPGGYCDCFHALIEEHDGEAWLYSDLIEIPREIFDLILDDKLPYRSAEYIPSKRKIKGLALLPSREPFFHDLGILNAKTLCKEPMTLKEEEARCFQNRSHYLTTLPEEDMGLQSIFQTKEKHYENPDDPEKKDHSDNEEAENHSEDDKMDKLYQSFQSFMDNCEKRFSAMEEKMSSYSSEEKPKPRGLMPTTGAYQDEDRFKAYTEQITAKIAGQFEEKLSEIKGALEQKTFDDEIETEIKNYCDLSGESYQNVSGFLKQIDGRKQKKIVLQDKMNTAIANRNFFSPNHPAKKILGRTTVPADETLKKYQEESPEMQSLICEMVIDYSDPDNQDYFNSAQAKLAYPNAEAWIDTHVKQEKKSPGHYMKKIRKK